MSTKSTVKADGVTKASNQVTMSQSSIVEYLYLVFLPVECHILANDERVVRYFHIVFISFHLTISLIIHCVTLLFHLTCFSDAHHIIDIGSHDTRMV